MSAKKKTKNHSHGIDENKLQNKNEENEEEKQRKENPETRNAYKCFNAGNGIMQIIIKHLAGFFLGCETCMWFFAKLAYENTAKRSRFISNLNVKLKWNVSTKMDKNLC